MRISILFFLICGLAIPGVGVADGSGGNTMASTMEVYVFPKAGQQSEQQSRDEAACYEWATSNTGADPFELHKQSITEAEATEKAKATVPRLALQLA